MVCHSPAAGAGITLERPDDIRRYPATVEAAHLGCRLLTAEATVDAPRVEREIPLDDLEARLTLEKVVQWYNLLLDNGITDFSDPESEKPDAEEA